MQQDSLKILCSLLSKEELATNLKVSVPTIDKWIRNKKITPIKIGRRVYFNDSSILNMLKNDGDSQSVSVDTGTPGKN